MPSRERSDRTLALADKLFQRSIQDQVRTIAGGGRLPAPLVVELDPTTACDEACAECISGRLLNQGGFSAARLLRLAEELVEAGVRAVILIGGGEPLLHPAIGEVISILGRAGVAVGVTTNGTRIDRHLDVLAEWASWTRVSVDAGSAETYAVFRPHRSGRNVFDQVIANLRELAARKRGTLGYSFLVLARETATNVHDLSRAALLAREIGCDYFEVKPSYDLDHFLLSQPAEVVEELAEQLSAVQALEDETFRILGPSTLDVILRREPAVEPKDYDRCLVSELRTLVTPQGAYMCPYFRGLPEKRYGDLTAGSFQEVWQSREREIVTGRTRPSRDCRFHCIRHRSNQALYAIGRGDTDAGAREDFDPFL